MSDGAHTLRGANLGGWLVLERWMTPSLFEGLAAPDETAWALELGARAPARLRAHWQGFIGRDDLAWLAELGISAVRIPVAHWILGPPIPYHAAYGASAFPYVEGGIDVLDRALGWAEALGLRVVLDLHAAPGCQNGFDNGGIAGACDWHTREEYLAHSVDVLARLARRYRASPALHAIEVLNEPRWDVPTELLERYYARAYAAVRAHCAAEQVAVIFHDGFRAQREWASFLADPALENVALDVHRYQCFDPADLALDLDGHLRKTSEVWAREPDGIQTELGRPALVGEWSLGLGALDPGDAGYRAYAEAQLAAFARYAGWFFWSYRTETMPAWSLVDCVARGWLPDRLA